MGSSFRQYQRQRDAQAAQRESDNAAIGARRAELRTLEDWRAYARSPESARTPQGSGFTSSFVPWGGGTLSRQDMQAVRQLEEQKIIDEFKAGQEEANLANIERYDQGLSIYDALVERYQPGQTYSPTYQASVDELQKNISDFQPGGTYGQGALATYDVGARKSRASAYQSLVSSGMANVTGSFDRQATVDRGVFGKQVEDERTRFLTGARTAYSQSLSDYDLQRRQALERTQTGKIGFIERREDAQPDPNLLFQMLSRSSSAYA